MVDVLEHSILLLNHALYVYGVSRLNVRHESLYVGKVAEAVQLLWLVNVELAQL